MKKRYEALIGLVVAVLIGIAVACTAPPPVKVGPPRPVPTTIPTKPVPTDHPIEVRACFSGERCIIWLDRSHTRYVNGPVDPAFAPALCAYRPDLGDVYYSEAFGQVLAPPAGCPA